MPIQPTKDDIKTEIFADTYIKNGMNGMKAYQKISPRVTPETAMTQASRMLRRDKVQKSIQERLPSDSILSRVITENITNKPEDKFTHDTRYKYVNLALKLKGYLNDNHNTNVNVGLFVDNKGE